MHVRIIFRVLSHFEYIFTGLYLVKINEEVGIKMEFDKAYHGRCRIFVAHNSFTDTIRGCSENQPETPTTCKYFPNI